MIGAYSTTSVMPPVIGPIYPEAEKSYNSEKLTMRAADIKAELLR